MPLARFVWRGDCLIVLRELFTGLTFYVSGAFEVSQPAMKKQLQEAGGKIATYVTAAVDHLICNEEGSTKYQAMEDKGLPLVNE